ncbi:MAG: hypothetical protein K6U80_07960 [Firmicutes bacterium]|nr:hypothetical protein [Bacillota bacterium]
MVNKYGINLDLGFPLGSSNIDLLYIEFHPQKYAQILDWCKNPDSKPLMIIGQIGIGKTTFIQKILLDQTACLPDIILALDTQTPYTSEEGFWGYLFGKLIEFALKINFALTKYDLIEELRKPYHEINTTVNLLTKRQFSFKDIRRQQTIFSMIHKYIDEQVLQSHIEDLFKAIEENLGRKIFILVEGVDKFKLESPEYQLALGVLNLLTQYKTLYEANLVHVLGNYQKWQNSEKLYLTCVEPVLIQELLKKRLGHFSQEKHDAIYMLANLSGGNPRQAIRLINYYQDAYEKANKSFQESINYACSMVRTDLLKMDSVIIEPELLKAVEKDGFYIPTQDFNPIYYNWLFVYQEPQDIKWPVRINPLIQPAIKSFNHITPQDPRILDLKKWAEANEVSSFGLDYDLSANYIDLLKTMQKIEVLGLKINEVFDSLAAHFLVDSRKDLIIIVYENLELATVANDYIIGKAGTFKPIIYESFSNKSNAAIIERLLEKGTTVDGFSIFFEERLNDKAIRDLDERRDLLLEYKMIWWIPKKDISRYLSEWIHIRQNARIIRLEENILGIITSDEIEQDIADLKEINFKAEKKEHVQARLKNVLKYLKERRKNETE